MTLKIRKLFENRIFTGLFIAFVAFVVALLGNVFEIFNVLELKSYDLRFSWRGPQKNRSDNIVIVGIDDQSFEDLRLKWPFPRSLYAKAIDNLRLAGARAIVIDIEFSDPDEFNPQNDLLLAQAARVAGNVFFAAKLVNYKNNAGRRIIKPNNTLMRNGADWALIDVPEGLDGFNRQYYVFRRAEGSLAFIPSFLQSLYT